MACKLPINDTTRQQPYVCRVLCCVKSDLEGKVTDLLWRLNEDWDGAVFAFIILPLCLSVIFNL